MEHNKRKLITNWIHFSRLLTCFYKFWGNRKAVKSNKKWKSSSTR